MFDGSDGEAYVFARPDGSPTHPQVLSDMFNKLVARSGLPRIRLHDLRHTHATLLLKAGIPIKVVSERLGHSTPGFTMATYQHILPGMQQEAARPHFRRTPRTVYRFHPVERSRPRRSPGPVRPAGVRSPTPRAPSPGPDGW